MSEELCDEDRIDAIYGNVDEMLCGAKFAEVDALLDSLNVDAMPVLDRLAYLSITLSATNILTRRADFYQRVRVSIERGDPKHATELLAGLDGKPASVRVAIMDLKDPDTYTMIACDGCGVELSKRDTTGYATPWRCIACIVGRRP